MTKIKHRGKAKKWERLFREERTARRRENHTNHHRIVELEREVGAGYWRARLEREHPIRTHYPWTESLNFDTAPLVTVQDVRPRVLAKALRIDPGTVFHMANRPDDAKRMVEERMAQDLARELIRQGFVKYEWAEARGEYEYRARHEPSNHYRTLVWSVLVSAVPMKGKT
jgi:hypothetical protein